MNGQWQLGSGVICAYWYRKERERATPIREGMVDLGIKLLTFNALVFIRKNV